MSDLKFFRIRSWHVLREWQGSEWIAVCGRRAPDSSETVDALPTGKGCETCFRYTVTSEDNSVPLPEDDGSTHDESVP